KYLLFTVPQWQHKQHTRRKRPSATATMPSRSRMWLTTQRPSKAGQTMKALVWQGKNKVEMVDVPRPKILEDRDVILKVTGSTVCGSDLHLLHGAVIQMSKGDILGHEFCGIVDEVGLGVNKDKIKVGKRYVASFQIACGDCFFCKQKLSSQCEKTNSNTTERAMYGGRTAGMFGYAHFTGGFAGGQAEYVRVPLGDVNLLEIPDDVPDEKGNPLPFRRAGDFIQLRQGHGRVPRRRGGHLRRRTDWANVRRLCLQEGASKVIFVDTEPRLSFIKEHFPTQHQDKMELVDFKKLSHGVTSAETVVSRLKELCGGRGPDAALECAAGEYAKGWMHWLEMATGAETDTSEIINEMVEGVRNYGRCGVTGIYVGYTNHFNVGSLMQRGIRLIGNGQAPVHKYWEELLEMIRRGELDPLQMVSHRVRLEDLDKVYYKFEKREDGMQKVFVETRFSLPAAKGSPSLTTY
ncbi:hypothetical protein ACCO45_012867, partial [Purpureocillium lilacinum]